jgi:hypothetical protein
MKKHQKLEDGSMVKVESSDEDDEELQYFYYKGSWLYAPHATCYHMPMHIPTLSLQSDCDPSRAQLRERVPP